MEDDSKTVWEGDSRRVAPGIVEETIEHAFTADYDVQKEGIETPTRNIVEGMLINIVEQRHLGTILINNVDRLASWTHF